MKERIREREGGLMIDVSFIRNFDSTYTSNKNHLFTMNGIEGLAENAHGLGGYEKKVGPKCLGQESDWNE